MLKHVLQQKWGIELVALFLASLGFFLLIEPFQFYSNLSYIFWVSTQDINGIGRAILNALIQIKLSHMIGFLLLGVSILLVLKRFLVRLRNSPEYVTLKCPICHSKLRRSHRHPSDRIINYFIPVYRYRCRNRECGWGGLRVRSLSLSRENLRDRRRNIYTDS